MFVPDHFRINDAEEIVAMMRAYPFATLVTNGANGLTATHLPTVLTTPGDGPAVIEAHLSRANDQWKMLDSDAEALVIFAGPQSYIHPGWYPSKAAEGKAVPTWNYAAVHAYGRATVINDGDWLKAHVGALTDQQEKHRAQPWSIDDAPSTYIQMMVRGIVGIRIEVTRLEGKAKMSQNRTAEDRAGVVEGLAAEPGDQAGAVADWVRRANT